MIEAIEGIDGEVEYTDGVVEVVHQEAHQERVVLSDEGTTLSIIGHEILTIRKKQLKGEELTYAESKKLDTLLKLKLTIDEVGVPEPYYDYSQVSDKDVLEAIKLHKDSNSSQDNYLKKKKGKK